MIGLSCLRCNTLYPADLPIDSTGCPACRAVAPSNFEVVYAEAAIAKRVLPRLRVGGGFSSFADFLPVDAADLVSLAEGSTPLIDVPAIAGAMGLGALQIKDESRNPTWSHKDRFSAVAVSYARKQGHGFVATASSGNAGASLAAYAAKAGMDCLVLTFEGAAAPLVEQIRRYGAIVVELKDKAQRWTILAEGQRRFGWFVTSPFSAPVVGSNPYGMEGYKTIAYEIAIQSDDIPEWVIVPTAYGDLLRGIWKGFKDLHEAGCISRLPKVAAAEVLGSLSRTISSGSDAVWLMEGAEPSQAMSIGVLQGTYQSLVSIRESGGTVECIDDTALWAAQAQLARHEGIFGELSGVAAIAAAQRMRQKGVIGSDDKVVCLMTASGLKDIDQMPPARPSQYRIEGRFEEVAKILTNELGTSSVDR
ncbi:pyridoxal-phosphate dependent enzyme [Mesorhizobium camelthorni]|uniref:Pyridoxal-phosphate dependent enzyme n=1 Tax=Allomesorhizobium camelthorni TaxID=475069 RepID=A0A6G4WII1_9HYPH|nr:pyridoxal-phosphate dependent enzyme [Mesorhizobium camelthorni]